MDVRYDGSDGNMPDLRIVNDTRSEAGDPVIGVLCTLYRWHWDDPVDAFEMRRNDRIKEWQGNRNPLLDHPEWAEEFYGAQCGPWSQLVQRQTEMDTDQFDSLPSAMDNRFCSPSFGCASSTERVKRNTMTMNSGFAIRWNVPPTHSSVLRLSRFDLAAGVQTSS